MPDTPVKLHLAPQQADALLDPIRLELARIEARLDRFTERTRLSEADAASLSAARSAIATARERIIQLRGGQS